MTVGLHNGLGAAALTLGLAVAAAGRADTVVDGRLTPNKAPTASQSHLTKGQLNLAQGKAGAAAAELEQAVRLKPADAHNALWLHLARNKEHAPDAVELQINADKANRTAWPGPLLDYLTGKIDANAVLAKAGEGPGQSQGKSNRLCEADLFLGQEDLAKGRRSQGLERLQAAAHACDADTGEAKLALADLGVDAPKPVLTPASNPAPKPPSPLAGATLKPASVQPAVQTQVQRLPGDLLLRGSLK